MFWAIITRARACMRVCLCAVILFCRRLTMLSEPLLLGIADRSDVDYPGSPELFSPEGSMDSDLDKQVREIILGYSRDQVRIAFL